MVALGRVEGPADPRDANYPMQLVLAAVSTMPTSRYWYPGKVVLNQGNLGACVGFTGANWMQNSPTRTLVDNQVGFDLYAECKKIDGIPNIEGTYARVLLEILRAQGRVKRYLWANNAADLKAWVLSTGPVLVGTTWRQDMFHPDAAGFIHPTGNIVGGHEYLVRGYSKPLAAYRCRNSWGSTWGIGNNAWAGNGGEFWISEADLNSLIWGGGGNWGDAVGVEEAKL